jgi:hypothetical protein
VPPAGLSTGHTELEWRKELRALTGREGEPDPLLITISTVIQEKSQDYLHDGSAVGEPALNILGFLTIMINRANDRNAELERERRLARSQYHRGQEGISSPITQKEDERDEGPSLESHLHTPDHGHR